MLGERESERVRVGEFDEEERRDLCVREPSVNERERGSWEWREAEEIVQWLV